MFMLLWPLTRRTIKRKSSVIVLKILPSDEHASSLLKAMFSLLILSIHTDCLLGAENLAKGVAFQGNHKRHLSEAAIPSSFHSFEI